MKFLGINSSAQIANHALIPKPLYPIDDFRLGNLHILSQYLKGLWDQREVALKFVKKPFVLGRKLPKIWASRSLIRH